MDFSCDLQLFLGIPMVNLTLRKCRTVFHLKILLKTGLAFRQRQQQYHETFTQKHKAEKAENLDRIGILRLRRPATPRGGRGHLSWSTSPTGVRLMHRCRTSPRTLWGGGGGGDGLRFSTYVHSAMGCAMVMFVGDSQWRHSVGRGCVRPEGGGVM